MKDKRWIALLLFLAAAAFMIHGVGLSSVVHEGEKVFIVDRTGERWDVSQAATIGFKPEQFQFGIGRYAFETLDDSHLTANPSSVPDHLRVIGVAQEEEAQAYSVRTLRGHEVANTTIGSKPIAVAY